MAKIVVMTDNDEIIYDWTDEKENLSFSKDLMVDLYDHVSTARQIDNRNEDGEKNDE